MPCEVWVVKELNGNTQTELIDKMQPTDELTEAQHMDLFFSPTGKRAVLPQICVRIQSQSVLIIVLTNHSEN